MLSWGAGGIEHKLRSSKPPTPHESCVSRIKYNDGDCEPPPLLQEKIRIAATEKLHKLLPRRRRCWKTMGQNSNNQVGWGKENAAAAAGGGKAGKAGKSSRWGHKAQVALVTQEMAKTFAFEIFN